MKLFLYIIITFLLTNNPEISEIRKMYPEASASETNAKQLSAKLASIDKDDNKTLLAYKGASITIMCKFGKKITDKISFFKEGSKIIEQAVAAEPKNCEIRFVRLSIQANIPRFINYRKNIDEDKAFMLEHYDEQPAALKSYLKSYILHSDSFSDKEKKSVKEQ